MDGMNYDNFEVSSNAPTKEVAGLTEKDECKSRRPGEDPRFARPETRRPIKEDSGTYSIVYKRSDR